MEVGQVAYGKLDAPYQDQWELMEDAFALIDYRLYLYYKYHQWLGPQGDMRNMLGLVVSREEFEHNLTKAAQTGLMEKLAPEELEQIRVGEAVLERRLALTAPDAFPLLKVFQRFGLDPFSRWVLTLCYGARLDTKYERLLAYLQDDITKKIPTVQLAVQLYLPLGESVEAYTAAFARESLFNSLFQREGLLEGNLQLKPMVLAFLSAGSLESGNGIRIFNGAEETPADPLVIGRDLAAALDGAMAGGPQAIAITGPGTPVPDPASDGPAKGQVPICRYGDLGAPAQGGGRGGFGRPAIGRLCMLPRVGYHGAGGGGGARVPGPDRGHCPGRYQPGAGVPAVQAAAAPAGAPAWPPL